MGNRNLYWGEIHTHTALSDGNGTPEENFEIARSHLDFWAMADHAYDREVFDFDYWTQWTPGHPLLNEQWGEVQAMCRAYEKPGSFIPFLAYEWTNFQYGHHNVYYLDYDRPIRMPPTLPELYAVLRGEDAMVIPHHTGYPVRFCGKNWDFHDETLTPFVEIYSWHGTSEEPAGLEAILTGGSWMGPGDTGGSVQEALSRGYKLGIMASSDSHLQHPGAYDNGLIAVYADELTRPCLWEAMKARRIYGVTGDRIGLQFSVNGAPMGSAIVCDGRRSIEIGVMAWDKVERVDIIKNGAILHTFLSPMGAVAPVARKRRIRFFVEWGWDRLGTPEWENRLSVRDGRILQAIPCYRGTVADRIGRGISRLAVDECRWRSRTARLAVGGFSRACADGMAFEVEIPPQGWFDFDFAAGPFRQSLSLSPEEILSRSRVEYMENIPVVNNGAHWNKMKSYAKFRLHQGWPTEQLTLRLNHEDKPERRHKGRTDYYYARVIQRNGQRAWSSPCFVADKIRSGTDFA